MRDGQAGPAQSREEHVMSDLKLIEGAKAGNSKAVEALVESGADVNQQDKQGWTALNFAAGK